MIEFDPNDPFPLVSSGNYEDEKNHAAKVDAWLGFDVESIERRLRAGGEGTSKEPYATSGRPREFWLSKSVQTFSTPYTELRAILEEIRPLAGETVVDLGAAYGRMAHVLDRHFPEASFDGYEIVRERQEEGQRVMNLRRLARASIQCRDVTQIDFSTSAASVYFIYDFGSREDVEIAVENLKRAANRKTLTVVARGGRSRDIIEKNHPWLSQVISPIHRAHYTIYRSGL